MQLPKDIHQALEGTGKPWNVEKGSRHRKIKVAGRLVGILPLGKVANNDRKHRNVLAQIRRA